MKLGVIVGRFQTPYLTKPQLENISFACENSDELAIFVLSMEISFSYHNPLPFDTRLLMLKRYLEDKKKPARFFEIKDEKYASRIKTSIDDKLLRYYPPATKMTMYGKGFIEVYDGICDTVITDFKGTSGTHARNEALEQPKSPSEIHTKGQIFAALFREAVCYNYVVVLPYYREGDKLKVLAVKPEKYLKLSFPMIRIRGEEKSIQGYAKACMNEFLPLAGQLEYRTLNVQLVDDWRFRKSRDVCIYHPVIVIIGNNPALRQNITAISELKENEFEEEFHSIIRQINTV